MVAKISLGRNILGLLYYNEDKVKKGKASVLSAHGFGSKGGEGTVAEKHKRFRFFTEQNSRAKLNAFHVSLNFSPKDQLDREQLRYIAQQYMERIGYGAQPYLAYQHFDAGHRHVHIVSTNITREGKRIETHNLGREKSEKARKELEQELGLVKAEHQKEQRLSLEPLEKLEYGKKESKAAMANVVTEVMRTYAFSSLSEFAAILRQFNVGLIQCEEGSRMKAHGGLAYTILDNRGKRIGVPIKASAFYVRPTMARLEQRMEHNRKIKERSVGKLRESFGTLLQQSSGKGRDFFEKSLRKLGMAAEFHYSKTGEVFGLTLIDHIHRTAFKASDLSRNWSGKKVMQLLEGEGKKIERPSERLDPLPYPGKGAVPNHEGAEKHGAPVWKVDAVPVLKDFLFHVQLLLRPETQERNDPFHHKKKKKKRRKLP
ncbi:conjugal transfer protein MobB [Echinicola sediminis]